MNVSRIHQVLATVFVSACGLTIWCASGAVASADSGAGIEINLPAHGTGFTRDPSGSLLDVSRMIPGDSASGVMGVRNGSGDPADLTISSDNVESDENGCEHAELREPGGCSPGKGQLGEKLLFTLGVATSQTGPYTTAWTGNAAELANGVQVGPKIGGGNALWVRMAAALPVSVGNEVQSDTYGFDLRITLESPAGTAALAVGGLSASAAGPGSGGTGLAFTGTAVAMIGGAGLLLIVAGVLLMLGVRVSRAGRVTLS